jgi:hypothetical protein
VLENSFNGEGLLGTLMLDLLTILVSQQPTMSVVKLEEGPSASVKPGQESCEIIGIITLSA